MLTMMGSSATLVVRREGSVRTRMLTALLAILLVVVSFAVGNYAASHAETSKVKWDYAIVRHSPHMTEHGSDFRKFRRMGSDGWELASSYPAKGEVIYSLFKRTR